MALPAQVLSFYMPTLCSINYYVVFVQNRTNWTVPKNMDFPCSARQWGFLGLNAISRSTATTKSMRTNGISYAVNVSSRFAPNVLKTTEIVSTFDKLSPRNYSHAYCPFLPINNTSFFTLHEQDPLDYKYQLALTSQSHDGEHINKGLCHEFSELSPYAMKFSFKSKKGKVLGCKQTRIGSITYDDKSYARYTLRFKSEKHRAMNGDPNDLHREDEYIQNVDKAIGPISFKWVLCTENKKTGRKTYAPYTQEALSKSWFFGSDGDSIWFSEDEDSIWWADVEEEGLNAFIHVDAVLNETLCITEMDIPIEVDKTWWGISEHDDGDDDVKMDGQGSASESTESEQSTDDEADYDPNDDPFDYSIDFDIYRESEDAPSDTDSGSEHESEEVEEDTLIRVSVNRMIRDLHLLQSDDDDEVSDEVINKE